MSIIPLEDLYPSNSPLSKIWKIINKNRKANHRLLTKTIRKWTDDECEAWVVMKDDLRVALKEWTQACGGPARLVYPTSEQYRGYSSKGQTRFALEHLTGGDLALARYLHTAAEEAHLKLFLSALTCLERGVPAISADGFPCVDPKKVFSRRYVLEDLVRIMPVSSRTRDWEPDIPPNRLVDVQEDAFEGGRSPFHRRRHPDKYKLDEAHGWATQAMCRIEELSLKTVNHWFRERDAR
ncbi:hypothetical protein DFP72DRAFT_847507 [Ephemerocybe angulata]|uniref:Uncharacterized protein n=1 Tax=Ephemerocybe angulata TaxID=980116 RepID=A0A8H6HY96_9AGAR|nr:hypothetical protein DFP72DRAFT_847507 [Tulosesus angulatus]